jgi:hypothetical protein
MTGGVSNGSVSEFTGAFLFYGGGVIVVYAALSRFRRYLPARVRSTLGLWAWGDPVECYCGSEALFDTFCPSCGELVGGEGLEA